MVVFGVMLVIMKRLGVWKTKVKMEQRIGTKWRTVDGRKWRFPCMGALLLAHPAAVAILKSRYVKRSLLGSMETYGFCSLLQWTAFPISLHT